MSSERAARNRSAETQGFLGEANPPRVSRELRRGRKAQPMHDGRHSRAGAGALRPMGRRGRIRERGSGRPRESP